MDSSGIMKTITDRLKFPEGPVVLDDGSVLVVEIPTGTITRVDRNGTLGAVAKTGGGPNGLAIGPDGKCYVCNNGGMSWHAEGGLLRPGLQPADYSGGRIERVDIATGLVEVLYTHVDGRPLKAPNDIVFDRHGGFYFTDLGKARDRDFDRGTVYYARSDGRSIVEVVHPLLTPNGIGLSPDDRHLYVAETQPGRLWEFDIVEPGRISRERILPFPIGRLVVGLPGYQLFDSLAVEESGNICVATLIRGGITVVSPAGEIVDFVAVPGEALVTNICFGGEDLRTAYITASSTGRLIEMPWPRPGCRLNYSSQPGQIHTL
jgi:gluconolactonase